MQLLPVLNQCHLSLTYPAKPKPMDMNLFHNNMGHIHAQYLRATAVKHNIHLTGNLHPCLSCTFAKLRHRGIPKQASNKAQHPGERICMDVSYIHAPSLGGSHYWVLVVDDFSKFKWDNFVR